MKPLKIAMMGMTHGHTRKYYQTLKDNPKLDWIAVSCANEEVKKILNQRSMVFRDNKVGNGAKKETIIRKDILMRDSKSSGFINQFQPRQKTPKVIKVKSDNTNIKPGTASEKHSSVIKFTRFPRNYSKQSQNKIVPLPYLKNNQMLLEFSLNYIFEIEVEIFVVLPFGLLEVLTFIYFKFLL